MRRIECVAQALHRREVAWGKDQWEGLAFLVTDSVLAADRAAEIDARSEDVVTGGDDRVELALLATIEDQQRAPAAPLRAAQSASRSRALEAERHASVPHSRASAAIARSLASTSELSPATSTSNTAPASCG